MGTPFSRKRRASWSMRWYGPLTTMQSCAARSSHQWMKSYVANSKPFLLEDYRLVAINRTILSGASTDQYKFRDARLIAASLRWRGYVAGYHGMPRSIG